MNGRETGTSISVALATMLLSTRMSLRQVNRSLGARLVELMRVLGVELPRWSVTFWLGIWWGLPLIALGMSILNDVAKSPMLIENRWLASLILTGMSLALASSLLVTSHHLRRKHQQLFHVASSYAWIGFSIGQLSLLLIPCGILLAQCLRNLDSGPVFLGAVAVAMAILSCIIWNRIMLFMQIATIVVAGAVGVLELWGRLPILDFVESASFQAIPLMIGLVVASGGTYGFCFWCATKGYGPRRKAAFSTAAISSGIMFSLNWLGLLVISDTIWNRLAAFIPMSCYFLSVLLLRVRQIRFFSIEARGYQLLLLRGAPAVAMRLWRASLERSVLLVLPSFIAATITLWWYREINAIGLLAGLAVLEIGLDSFLVQRVSVILPASDLASLGHRSKSGLSAASCLVIVFTATGLNGVNSAFDLRVLTEVYLTSGLFAMIGVLFVSLVIIDSKDWLRELTASARGQHDN